MKVCTWAVVVGVLVGSTTESGEVANSARRTSMSISTGEDAAGQVLVTSTSSGGWPVPMLQESSGWWSFHNGHLWADYCQSPHGGASASAECPRPASASRLRPHWTLPKWGKRSNRTVCRHRTSPLDLLRGLLGWQPRPVYHTARQERLDCPEPAAVIPADDPPPAPPVVLDSIESMDRQHAEPPADPPTNLQPPRNVTPPTNVTPPVELDVAPAPSDPGLITPMPNDDGSAADPDEPGGDMELAPVPADDPVPEPKPEVPRNKLPKQRSAQNAAPGPHDRPAVASRLSDFIRTR